MEAVILMDAAPGEVRDRFPCVVIGAEAVTLQGIEGELVCVYSIGDDPR